MRALEREVVDVLAQGLPIAAHVEADTLHRFLVTGRQRPSAATDTALEQLILRTRNAATVAANFVAAGIPTFLDDVVSTSRQVALLAELLPRARIIVLTATDDVVLQRDSMRSKHTAAHYIGVADQIGDAVGSAATWINTTGLTAEQTTTTALHRLDPALIRGWSAP